jgi:glycerophosphoryl diester phosphodiesterase
VANLIELKKSIMPSAGVEFPLVQLFDDIWSTGPYDFRWNASHGADLNALYGGLAGVVGGISAGMHYQSLASEPALQWMKANYASGIGPWKVNILPRENLASKQDANGDGKAELATRNLGLVHPFLSYALKAGLVVHPYTLRAEENYLSQTPTGINESVIAEAVQLYGLGVQGFFIDQPDLGVAARDIFLDISQP